MKSSDNHCLMQSVAGLRSGYKLVALAVVVIPIQKSIFIERSIFAEKREP